MQWTLHILQSEYSYQSGLCEIQISFKIFRFINIYILLYFQLVRLDNLFAYWNVKSEMFYHYGYNESLVSKEWLKVSTIAVHTVKNWVIDASGKILSVKLFVWWESSSHLRNFGEKKVLCWLEKTFTIGGHFIAQWFST